MTKFVRVCVFKLGSFLKLLPPSAIVLHRSTTVICTCLCAIQTEAKSGKMNKDCMCFCCCCFFFISFLCYAIKELLSNHSSGKKKKKKSYKDFCFPAVKQQLASLCYYMQKRPLVDPYLKKPLRSQALMYVPKRAFGKYNFKATVFFFTH